MPFNSSTFSLRQQQGFFDRHGDFVDWYGGHKCSCSDSQDASRANPNCRSCKGTGFWYDAAKRIQGLVTGLSSQRMLLESGIAIPGDLIFSSEMLTMDVITDYDKIVLSWDGAPHEGDLLKRGQADSDFLIYNATDITSVTRVDQETGTITAYISGTEYSHASGSDVITWLTPTRPPTGAVYSVKYLAIFEWLCFQPPAQRYERGTPLGNRVLLRKKHMVSGK